MCISYISFILAVYIRIFTYKCVFGHSLVLDIIHFFQDLDVDFWILEGATRYTNRTSIETQEHARLFGETEYEI